MPQLPRLRPAQGHAPGSHPGLAAEARTTPRAPGFAQNGFVISGRQAFPTFVYGYKAIYALDLPVFISADSILQAVHRSYDAILKALEQARLIEALDTLLAGDARRAGLRHRVAAVAGRASGRRSVPDASPGVCCRGANPGAGGTWRRWPAPSRRTSTSWSAGHGGVGTGQGAAVRRSRTRHRFLAVQAARPLRRRAAAGELLPGDDLARVASTCAPTRDRQAVLRAPVGSTSPCCCALLDDAAGARWKQHRPDAAGRSWASPTPWRCPRSTG